MSESRTLGWQQALGFIGVIVSLLFVAYELKQSRDIAIAEMYLATTQLEFEALSLMLTPQMLRPALDKFGSGDALLPGERAILHQFSDVWLTISDVIHFQYQMGLVTKEVWEAERAQIRALLAIECFSERTQHWGDRDRPSFADDIADLIAAAPSDEDCF